MTCADPVAGRRARTDARRRVRPARAPSTGGRWRRAPALPRSLGNARCVGVRNCRQVVISAPVGLFSGGTQRTALVIAVPTSFEAVVGPRLDSRPRRNRTRSACVEQVAGIVAGERPAGAVGAAQARREADDQQPHAILALGRQEGRHRRIEPSGLALPPCREKSRSRGQSGQSCGGSAVERRSAAGINSRRRFDSAGSGRRTGRSDGSRPTSLFSDIRSMKCRPGGADRRRSSAAAWPWSRPR